MLRSYFSAIPTPVAGLALGIASLGLGLEKALPLHSFGQTAGALAACLPLFCIACKFILHPALLQQELKHPVLGSILPTMAMALMLQSKSLSIVDARAAQTLWLFAVGLHLFLLLAFVAFRIRHFSLHHRFPTEYGSGKKPI